MKIVAISDTHSQHNNLQIPPCDILIHSGDITYFSKKGHQEVIDFLTWFARQPAKHKIFCGGNHDILLEKEEKFFKSVMPPGVTYLNDSEITVEGIRIWGSPITPWFYDWAWNRQRGIDIQKHWNKIPEGIDILFTHGPPKGIMDYTNGQNVGCDNLLEALKRIQPKIHIFGHIHVTYGVKSVKIEENEIAFFNAAMVNSGYKIVNKPHVINYTK